MLTTQSITKATTKPIVLVDFDGTLASTTKIGPTHNMMLFLCLTPSDPASFAGFAKYITDFTQVSDTDVRYPDLPWQNMDEIYRALELLRSSLMDLIPGPLSKLSAWPTFIYLNDKDRVTYGDPIGHPGVIKEIAKSMSAGSDFLKLIKNSTQFAPEDKRVLDRLIRLLTYEVNSPALLDLLGGELQKPDTVAAIVSKNAFPDLIHAFLESLVDKRVQPLTALPEMKVVSFYNDARFRDKTEHIAVALEQWGIEPASGFPKKSVLLVDDSMGNVAGAIEKGYSAIVVPTFDGGIKPIAHSLKESEFVREVSDAIEGIRQLAESANQEEVQPTVSYPESAHGTDSDRDLIEYNKQRLTQLNPFIQWETQRSAAGEIIFTTGPLAHGTAAQYLFALRKNFVTSYACLLRMVLMNDVNACLQINMRDIDNFVKNTHLANPRYQISLEYNNFYVLSLTKSDFNSVKGHPEIEWLSKSILGEYFVVSTPLSYAVALDAIVQLRAKLPDAEASLLSVEPSASNPGQCRITIIGEDVLRILAAAKLIEVNHYVLLLTKSDFNSVKGHPEIEWLWKCNTLGEYFVVSTPLSDAVALDAIAQLRAKLPKEEASLLSVVPSATSPGQYRITIIPKDVPKILATAKQIEVEKSNSASIVLPAASAPISAPQSPPVPPVNVSRPT